LIHFYKRRKKLQKVPFANMALKGCFSCLKGLVFITNFLFWLLGLGVMAVSLWLLFDQHLYLQTTVGDRPDFFIGTYIILFCGALMTLVGFLGCCGAWRESPWMLGTFFVFLVIIFLGEVSAGFLIYFKEASYERLISKSITSTVREKYHINSTATIATFDLIQEGLECCGAEGPADWSKSLLNGYTENSKELGVNAKPTGAFFIPRSCCINPHQAPCTEKPNPRVENTRSLGKTFHTTGCSVKMKKFFQEHIIYLLAACIGVAVLEILGMFFSMCLCCALKRIEDLKA